MFCHHNKKSTQTTDNSQMEDYEVLTKMGNNPLEHNYSITAHSPSLKRDRKNSSFFYKSDSSILVSVDNSDIKVFDQNGEEFELEIIEEPERQPEQHSRLKKKFSQLKKITAFGNPKFQAYD